MMKNKKALVIPALLCVSLSAIPASAQFNKLKNAIKKAGEATKPTVSGSDAQPAEQTNKQTSANQQNSTIKVQASSQMNASKTFGANHISSVKTIEAKWQEIGGPQSGEITQLLIAPSGQMFATVRDTIWTSADGKIWSDLEFMAKRVRHIALDSKGALYASFGLDGIHRSTDNGKTWALVSKGIPDSESIEAFAINSKGAICANANKGELWVSADNGKTWKTGGAGLPTFQRRAMDIVVLTALLDNSFVGGMDHKTSENASLVRSIDNGLTWTPVGEAVSAVVKPRGINSSSIEISALAAGKQGTVFAGAIEGYGVFRSTDGGTTWTHVLDLAPERSDYRGDTITGIAVDARNDVYVATSESGVFVSSDNGNSWQKLGDAGGLSALTTDQKGAIYGTSNGVLWRVSK